MTGCSARGLFGPLSGDVQPPAALAIEGVRIGQSGVPFSVKWGTNAVKRGYRIHVVDFVGYTPPHFSQKGDQVAPFFAVAPFAPIPCPKKKQKVCVLGAGCGCHASASQLNFTPFGASAGTFRVRVFSAPPNMTKKTGYTPF